MCKNSQSYHHFSGKSTFWLKYAQCVVVVIAAEMINNQTICGTSHQLTATCLLSVTWQKCLTQSYIFQFSHQTIPKLRLQSYKAEVIKQLLTKATLRKIIPIIYYTVCHIPRSIIKTKIHTIYTCMHSVYV